MAIHSGQNYTKTQNFDILAHPVKNPDGEKKYSSLFLFHWCLAIIAPIFKRIVRAVSKYAKKNFDNFHIFQNFELWPSF